MLQIEGLTVQFGGVRPIEQLTACLTEPVCGLIGPNGAGKTTLLNVLSGFVKPASGHIQLAGKALLPLSPVQRVRLGLRRSFQTDQVVDDLCVYDNVQAILDHLPPVRARHTQIAAALEYCGLSAWADCWGSELNLYQRRMVEIARSLVGQPRLILLDEPGAGMSETETQQLRQCLQGIPDYCGAQVLLIDHDVELIAACCTETLVLDFGCKLLLGDTQTVLKDDKVRRAYLGTEA